MKEKGKRHEETPREQTRKPEVAAEEEAVTEGEQQLEPETETASEVKEGIEGAEAAADELQAKLKGAEDKYIRLLAEFDNFKRRTLREQERVTEAANEGLMRDLIEVRENLERALKAGKDGGEGGGFYDGMKLIFSRFDDILGKHGLAPFGEVGDEFDPAIHDAMMKVANPDIPEDHVAQIVERGYRLRGQVMKHARVLVSAGSPEAAGAEKNE